MTTLTKLTTQINDALGVTENDSVVYAVNPEKPRRVFVTLNTVTGAWSAVIRDEAKSMVVLIDGVADEAAG